MLVLFESSSTTFNLFSATGKTKAYVFSCMVLWTAFENGSYTMEWSAKPYRRTIIVQMSEVFGLGVVKDFRSRGIGSKLLHVF